jgi:hypothetical protein
MNFMMSSGFLGDTEAGNYVALPAGNNETKATPVKSGSRGVVAQGAFAVLGLGVIAIYIKSSQNCAEDLRCVDDILRQLPKEYSAATLIFCGGIEFAISSAFCAMDAIPAYLEQMEKYKGIDKFTKGGGILLAAAAATMETLFVAIKAYPTIKEAIAAPTTWVSFGSSYPLSLFGVLNMATKDMAKLTSKVNQSRGLYKGYPVADDPVSYAQLCQQYASFRSETAARWKALIPQARTIEVDHKKNPLQFLYERTAKPVATPSRSLAKPLTKGLLGAVGLTASLGLVVPMMKNTYGFLVDEISQGDPSTELAVTLGLVTTLIGMARIRTVFSKNIVGAMSLADWSPSQDLEYQLNPKISVASWLAGVLMAYFSYSVVKEVALNNFEGPYQQPIAEMAAYSIEITHLIFSFHLVSLLLARYGGHYLYGVQQAVQEVQQMTLEQFDDFRLQLLTDAPAAAAAHGIEEIDDGDLLKPPVDQMPDLVPYVNEEPSEPARRESFGRRLCCFWRKEEAVVPQSSASSSSARVGNGV